MNVKNVNSNKNNSNVIDASEAFVSETPITDALIQEDMVLRAGDWLGKNKKVLFGANLLGGAMSGAIVVAIVGPVGVGILVIGQTLGAASALSGAMAELPNLLRDQETVIRNVLKK